MSTGTLSKLEKLKLQQDKLKSRIQKIESREKNKESKKDTRRKILVGSYFIDQATKEGTFEEIKAKLATFLTRNNDRVLFDLPMLENETP